MYVCLFLPSITFEAVSLWYLLCAHLASCPVSLWDSPASTSPLTTGVRESKRDIGRQGKWSWAL